MNGKITIPEEILCRDCWHTCSWLGIVIRYYYHTVNSEICTGKWINIICVILLYLCCHICGCLFPVYHTVQVPKHTDVIWEPFPPIMLTK